MFQEHYLSAASRAGMIEQSRCSIDGGAKVDAADRQQNRHWSMAPLQGPCDGGDPFYLRLRDGWILPAPRA